MRTAPRPRGVDIRLAASAEAPAAARRALERAEVPEELLEDARLLVSELVTNSVRHAGLPDEASIEFCVRASADALMVEVADGGQGFNHISPARPRAGPGPVDASGWGLFLVDRIADRWGAVQMDGETRVWFELTPGARHRIVRGDRAAMAR